MAQIYNWNPQGFRDVYEKYFYKQKECRAKYIRNCSCTGRMETYSRNFFTSMKLFEIRAQRIISHFNLQSGDTVLVMGCAFGFLMEELQNLGMVPYGFDNSPYIQQLANAPKNPMKVRFSIHNFDASSPTLVSSIQSATGINQFDCVITEDVLPSFSSYTQILNNCDALSNNVMHIVDTNVGEPLVKKTITEWVAVRPTHTWANVEGEILNANN